MFILLLYDFIYLSFIVPYMFFFLNNQGVGIKSEVEWVYNTYTMKSIEVYELVTPGFDPDALNIHDIYIVINHGVELKEKSPPSIGIIADSISGYTTHIKIVASCNYAI